MEPIIVASHKPHLPVPNGNGSVGNPRDQAETRLRGSSYPLLRGIACQYVDGVLTLRGRLPSYYLKQIALSLVRSIENVGPVSDRIEVVPSVHLLP